MKWGFVGSFIFVLVLVLIFALMARFDTSEPIPIEGVFEIKLGMSEKELREIVDTTHLKPGYKWREYENLDQKEFVLDSYIVNQSYTIENISLSFFNDSLYFIVIETYNAKTEDLLTEKYGVSNEYSKASRQSWTNTQYRYWETSNRNIKCGSDHTYSLSGDKKREIYYLRIYDENKQEILKRIREQYQKQKKVEEKREKKREHNKLIDAL